MKMLNELALITFVRGILNTAHRMAYPFLGVISRALGIDISALSLAVSSRNFVGMGIPLISPISDVRGRKFGMILGLSIFLFAIALVCFFPSFPTLFISLLLSVLGKYIFDPSVLSYMGDKVPYHRRGLAISVTEMGWSLAFILGIPAAGYLINRFGWVAPYYLFLALGILGITGIFFVIPADPAKTHATKMNLAAVLTVLKNRKVILALNVGLWTTAGNEIVNLIFGVWLEDTFYVQIGALAAASAIIGLSELGGEGLVALFTDKLGKPKALSIGIIASMLAAIGLPILAGTQTGALIGLFFFYIAFEFVMVSHLPMMTEVIPEARATAMSLNLMGYSVGRAFGAFLAPFIYKNFGFGMVTFFAIGFNGVALVALMMLAGKEIVKLKQPKLS
jgi:predicted MFS family arabinose efflux permease